MNHPSVYISPIPKSWPLRLAMIQWAVDHTSGELQKQWSQHKLATPCEPSASTSTVLLRFAVANPSKNVTLDTVATGTANRKQRGHSATVPPLCLKCAKIQKSRRKWSWNHRFKHISQDACRRYLQRLTTESEFMNLSISSYLWISLCKQDCSRFSLWANSNFTLWLRLKMQQSGPCMTEYLIVVSLKECVACGNWCMDLRPFAFPHIPSLARKWCVPLTLQDMRIQRMQCTSSTINYHHPPLKNVQRDQHQKFVYGKCYQIFASQTSWPFSW